MADVLTDLAIRREKPGPKPRKLSDGKGLFLLIHPNGSKYWRLKYRLAGKEKLFAIGTYSEVSLVQARAERDRARALVKEGRDPVIERHKQRAANLAELATTFESVAREWMDSKAEGWSHAQREKVKAILENDLFSSIGALPLTAISPEVLLAALRKIEGRGAFEVALRSRQWASAVFRYAIATGRAKDDPAIVLRGALKTRAAKGHASLGHEELGAFAKKIANYDGQPATRLGLLLLALTFVRTGELRAAEWKEFDLGNAQWSIPAIRMKMREPHIVPLSRQAIDVLKELNKITGHSRWLFPNERRPETYASENTFLYAIYRLGYHGRATGHGFRASASTILNEVGFHGDVIERQLAHTERNKIRAAYNRAAYLSERRILMQEWADLLDLLKAGAPWADIQAAHHAGLTLGTVLAAMRSGVKPRAFIHSATETNLKVVPGRLRRTAG